MAARALLLSAALLVAGCRTNEWAAPERATRRMMDAYEEGEVTPEQLALLQPEPVVTYARTYHPETGKLALERRIELYPDGRIVRDGLEREWYADGTPRTERGYRHGEPVGTWRTFFPDGAVESEVVMHAGEPGVMSWWYASGALAARGRALLGVKDGAWTHWHENGNPAEEGLYRSGLREGVWRMWWEDGTPRAEGMYAAGLAVGEWLRWSREGARFTGRGAG